jgi:hypothetical protein
VFLPLRALSVALLAFVAACEDSRMSVRIIESPELPLSAVNVTVVLPNHTRALQSGDFGTRDMAAPWISTPAHGTALVQVTIDGDSTSASARRISLGLRSDWEYTVLIQADTLDPKRSCLGCIGSQAFALPAARQRTPSDSLWFTWGGNSISNPVTY